MNWKRLLLIGTVVCAFGFAAAPRASAGISIGIGIGVPIGYGYGYARPYYPYGYGYGPSRYACYPYAGYGYRPYGYARPAVNVYVRRHYHWRNHRRVPCTRRHR